MSAVLYLRRSENTDLQDKYKATKRAVSKLRPVYTNSYTNTPRTPANKGERNMYRFGLDIRILEQERTTKKPPLLYRKVGLRPGGKKHRRETVFLGKRGQGELLRT